MNEQASAQYYKQFMPAYQQPQTQVPSNQPQPPQVHSHMKDNTNVIAKLNYMIHLLEEQKDERTNNVTEEVVLYSFLGIFVIFIVDSFVRVGKYVR
jgi:DNA-binding ferritin-like protein